MQTRYGYRPDNTWGTSPVFIETGSIANPDSKQVYYYQNDHLGTPYKIIDNTGFVVWSAQFDSFGQAHLSHHNLIVNNLRFPGQYYDLESGLHYNWHRYYDPKLGRYISSDPIGLAGGANTYGYVYQNPIIYVDVDGKVVVHLIAAGVGGIIGAYTAWDSGGDLGDILTGAVTGMITNMFGLQSILLRSIVSMASNTAGQMLNGSAVNRCGGFNLSQIAAAGVFGAINPAARLPSRIFSPTRNQVIDAGLSQSLSTKIVGFF